MYLAADLVAVNDDHSFGALMIASPFRQRLVCIALAAACLPALAQTPPPPAPPGAMPASRDGHPMMDHRPGGMHEGHMMRELMRLKTSLKLDANQTQLWDRAEAMMKPPVDMREQMKARHERMGAMLDDPNFDPRKLAADMDSAQADRTAKMKGMRDAWIAVYLSLNPVQRGQAREFLRSHMMHGPRMHGGMEWHHDGGHGMPGKDTDAPKR